MESATPRRRVPVREERGMSDAKVEIEHIRAFGIWTRQDQGQGEITDAERRAVEWLEGDDPTLTPELAKEVRDFVLTQAKYRVLLEQNLRIAVDEMRERAVALIGPMCMPNRQANAIHAAREEAVYEASMLAGQKILDIINRSQVSVRGAE